MNTDEVIQKIIYLKGAEAKGGKINRRMITAEQIQKKHYLKVTKVWELESTQNTGSEERLQGTI